MDNLDTLKKLVSTRRTFSISTGLDCGDPQGYLFSNINCRAIWIFIFCSAAKEVKRTAKATTSKKPASAAPKATTKAAKAPKAAKPQKAAPRVGGKR